MPCRQVDPVFLAVISPTASLAPQALSGRGQLTVTLSLVGGVGRRGLRSSVVLMRLGIRYGLLVSRVTTARGHGQGAVFGLWSTVDGGEGSPVYLIRCRAVN